ncbi:MAG TPA: NAD(P) transhydrogenase subunit alpha [Acidimicrobiales bacterium]|nr:NAD(P) transhydrogenase subunit alpha [Acidimicrobiales bacterium]
MKLAVPAESVAGERRVAIVPDVAKRLVAAGWTVSVQSRAGEGAAFTDAAYTDAGAEVAADAAACLGGAAAVVRVQPPSTADAALVPDGALVLSFLQPAASLDALRVLSEKRCSVFSFDLLPRISRAQSMDALSSQATVSGYRAALTAATRIGRFFPMLMTAAGTVPPAKVLVMGAGVAGLQAIATCRRLGAVVRAYDVRAAAKEEAESLGATFVDLGVKAEGAGGYARELTPEELAAQQRALADEVAKADAVVTTAAVPGRRAPVLVTRAMVEAMAPGAVVVDMAADSGGNCEVSQPGVDVVVEGTLVVGMSNPPSGMPTHASALYSRNVANILALLSSEGAVAPDWEDEIVAGTCVLRDGRPEHAPTAELMGSAS